MMKLPLFLTIFAGILLVFSQEESTREDRAGAFNNRRALIIGVDGLRADALRLAPTPNIDRLIAKGIVSYDAVAGGRIGTPTEQGTYSGPGWCTVLTGVFANKHGVEDNYFRKRNFDEYPHFFKRLKEYSPNAWLGSVVEWGGIDQTINIAARDSFDLRIVRPADEDVADEAALVFTERDPDVLFVHLIAPDGYGHTYGFDPENKNYRYSIRVTDRRIGKILDALNARAGVKAGTEDWLVVLVSDHGGLDRFHGGQSIYDRRIPFIVSGNHVAQGLEVSPGPNQSDVVPTVLHHLGVPIDPDWGLEGRPFGNKPLPTTNFRGSYSPIDGACSLIWRRPETDSVIGYRLYRNGNVIAVIDSSRSSYIDRWPGLQEAQIDVLYELEPMAVETDSVSSDRLSARVVRSSSLFEDDLAGYLPFDHSYSSVEGGAVKVTANEEDGPIFVESTLGTGLFFDGVDDSLSLTATDGTRFNFEGDFTVGLWYMMDQNHVGSPVIIGNKNWASPESPGFAVLGNRGGGDDIALHLSDGAIRLDPPTTDIAADQWYYLCATFDRDGESVLYTMNRSDYRSERISMEEIQNLDSGLSLSLAQDNRGRYTRMYVDDLAIWSRALNPVEVLHIFQMGKMGYSLGEMLDDGDVDGDGMADRWEVENFGSVDADALEDPDGDNIVNLIEWALGSDPMFTTRQPLLRQSRESDKVEVSFRSRVELEGVRLNLEVSSDLKSWELVSRNRTVRDSALAPGFQVSTYLVDTVGSRKFFRLAATR